MKTPCDASRRLYGSIKECPQLIWDDENNRYQCGLMLIPGLIGEGYRQELYAGAGCCSSMNSWRKDVKKRTGIELSTYANPLPPMLQKFIKCLAREFVSNDKMTLLIYGFMHELQKDGISEEECKTIGNHMIDIFNNQRKPFMKDFMG